MLVVPYCMREVQVAQSVERRTNNVRRNHFFFSFLSKFLWVSFLKESLRKTFSHFTLKFFQKIILEKIVKILGKSEWVNIYKTLRWSSRKCSCFNNNWLLWIAIISGKGFIGWGSNGWIRENLLVRYFTRGGLFHISCCRHDYENLWVDFCPDSK